MKVAGIAACVPKTKARTDAAYAHFKPSEVDRIIGNTGVLEKREAQEGTTVSDLCIAAADPLIEKLGWDRESIDALILVTTLADFLQPSTAHRIHEALGLGPNCLVFDVNLGCSGYTHGMVVMNSLMEGGLVKRALLLCGDMTSNRVRPRIAEAVHRTDLANAILFGDAGTATALVLDGEQQVHATQVGADGKGYRQIIVKGGAGRGPWGPEQFERREDEDGEERRPIDLILRGPEILTFTMKRVPPLMKALLEESQWNMDEIDGFVFHQANKFMLDYLQRRLKVPEEKFLLSIQEFGNTVSASIPLTLVVRGAELLAKRTKWSLLGFGVGLSWSGLMLETDAVVTLPLIEL